MVGLKEIRKKRDLSQSELAAMSGINYRSLQDYEQGHKKLTSANGDVLLRLSTVLGCTIPELLITEKVKGADLRPENQVDVATIQNQRIYCDKYKVAGRWLCRNGKIAIMFYFQGKQYMLPFCAVFTPIMLPCLVEATALQIEEKIEDILYSKDGFEEW